MDQRSPDKWSCSMMQRKAKNPRGPVPICPGGKFLPDPSDGNRLLPEHVSKTCLLLPQAGHASQEMPKPYSPSTWSHLWGQMAPACLTSGARISELPYPPASNSAGSPRTSSRMSSGCPQASSGSRTQRTLPWIPPPPGALSPLRCRVVAL